MVRYRATVSYEGTAYQGFQRQTANTPTVQGMLEQAITSVTRQPVTVIAAGRTDSGVHAVGQVITFDVEWSHDMQNLLRAINVNLPPDIALHDIDQQPGFHPRFDASARVYKYTIVQAPQRQPLWRNRAWYIRHRLNMEAMQAAGALLVGEHDFATFGQATTGTNTIRNVMVSQWESFVEPQLTRLVYTIEANAFLQHMVRRIVGLQVDVGRGALELADFEALFRKAHFPQKAVSVAPPQGLILEVVRYPIDSNFKAKREQTPAGGKS